MEDNKELDSVADPIDQVILQVKDQDSADQVKDQVILQVKKGKKKKSTDDPEGRNDGRRIHG